MWRLGACALLCASAAAAAGCAAPKSATVGCSHGAGQPITLIAMKSRLATEGLPVSVEHDLCDSDEIAELVSTDHSRLRCAVFSHPVYPKMQKHPRSRYEGPNYSGKAFVVAFAN